MQGDRNFLIPRIERATAEQVRELLEEAFKTIYPIPAGWDGEKGSELAPPEVASAYFIRRNAFRAMIDAGAWTSAAETLVPDGWCYSVRTSSVVQAVGHVWKPPLSHLGEHTSYAVLPALALAAACLRASLPTAPE